MQEQQGRLEKGVLEKDMLQTLAPHQISVKSTNQPTNQPNPKHNKITYL
jgi:hypothetical protein